MQKYTAIILSHYNVGEFDRLYIMYTLEQGLVKAVAKGVRKPAAKLAGHLEPGTLSEVYIAKARGLGQIASAITIENFRRIKMSLEKLSEILKIFRFLTKNFSEEEKNEKIFELLRFILKIADKADSADMVVEAFWWQLFGLMGNRPEVMRCVKCEERPRAAEKNYFSAERGGIVCGKCFAGESNLSSITSNQIKLLRIFLANPLKNILKVKLDEAELRGLERIREQFGRFNF